MAEASQRWPLWMGICVVLVVVIALIKQGRRSPNGGGVTAPAERSASGGEPPDRDRGVRKPPLSHADYNLIMRSNVVDDMPVEWRRLTELHVPTGQIVATDPLVDPESRPFIRRVPPGRYPVDLYLAKSPLFGTRIAIAVLTFREDQAVRYELAVVDEQHLEKLKEPDDFLGFPVDAGLGSFSDAETNQLYGKFVDRFHAENPKLNIYDDFFAARFKQNALPDDPREDGDWLDFHLPDAPERNVAMFSSGFGDGVYPAY